MAKKIVKRLNMRSTIRYKNNSSKWIERSRTCNIMLNRRTRNTYGAGETVSVSRCRRVAEEVVNVGEEVVVWEVVVSVRVAEEASSRAVALPKNLIAPLPYRITRGGVPEAYCPVPRCTPWHGMEKS